MKQQVSMLHVIGLTWLGTKLPISRMLSSRSTDSATSSWDVAEMEEFPLNQLDFVDITLLSASREVLSIIRREAEFAH